MRDDLRPGTPKHLYLPGLHRGVFNREGLEGQAEIILCEALIDALTFWAAGYRNVTSCYGVNGFTDEMLAAFKACGAQRILIAFDRDDAGDRAADALAKRLMSEGLDCFRLLFPKGEDANSYALAVKPAEKSLGVVIRSAEWLGAGTKPKLITRCFNTVHQWVEGDEALTNKAAAKEKTPERAPIPEPAAPAQPAAEALPATAEKEPEAKADDKQLLVSYGERRYRVRGLPKQLSEALKVNILVSDAGEGLHVDTLDLYQAKQR